MSSSSVPHPNISDPVPGTDVPVLPTSSHPRVIAIAEVLICSSVPTQLLIGSLLALAGWAPKDASGNLLLPYVLTLLLADTVVLVALMVTLTRAHGERATDLWLGNRPMRHEVRLGVMLVPAVFLGVVILLNILRLTAPWLHNVPQNPLEQLAGTASDAAIFALVAIVAGGVREELQRAFLLRRFERHLGGPVVGVVVLSLAFGLLHIGQGWDAAIVTGALGAFWAIVYLRRRSSVAPIVSHAGFNGLEILRVAALG
ncbi:MAG: CPBP family intramembrane glutamic endopeptidase [Vicinamibacterales bacterium]